MSHTAPRPFHRTHPLRRALAAWLIAALIGGLTLSLLPLPSRAQSAGDPLVLAFYYTWFDQNTWTYDKLSDLPAEPYVSADRGVMGRHIDQARRAGIDALLVAWYGPNNNQTEPNLAAMLEEANARGYKIGVLFESDSPFMPGTDSVTAGLQHLLSTHANHPAFLRVDGRPVIFFWRPTIYGVDTWRSIRSQADPNFSSIWIGEGVNTAYLAVFDGHHLYSNTWNPPADLNATNAKFARQVAAARASFGAYKFWVATVMPGYDDVKIRGGAGFARSRDGGAYFGQSWQAAVASGPNWIVINSFNEWPEGSYIEPSAAYGDQYLNLSATYSQQFKAGGGVAIAAVAPPAPLPPVPTATPTPPPTVPTAFINTGLLNLRAGPSTDSAIIGQRNQGAALPITGQHPSHPDWWQVAGDDGPAWVYAPLVTTGGPLEQVARLGDNALPDALRVTANTPGSTGEADAAPTVIAAEESAGESAGESAALSAAAPPIPVPMPVPMPSPYLAPHFDTVFPALAR